jgi:hypothetical protein
MGFQFGSIRFGSIRFGSVRFGLVQFGSVQGETGENPNSLVLIYLKILIASSDIMGFQFGSEGNRRKS